MRRLYLDLDGVLADFDRHFPAVFGIDHKGLDDATMWRFIDTYPSYFLDMPVCPGAIDFFNDVFHMRPIILTACPKTNYPAAAAQKRAWVRKHLSPEVLVLPVMGGKHKPLFMHAPGDILIDDYDRNCLAWSNAGGLAIRHRNFIHTRSALEFALEIPDPVNG